MLLQEFSQRATECIRMAERAKPGHDRDLLIELARARCGLTEEASKGRIQPRQ